MAVSATVAVAGAAVYGATTASQSQSKAISAQERIASQQLDASQQGYALQAQAMENQNAISREALDWQKSQAAAAQARTDALRTKWEDMYGSVEKNLADYYKSITPEKAVAVGLTTNQQQYHDTIAQLDQALAARGLSSSGVNAAAQTGMAEGLANANINTQITVPEQLRQEQANWLASSQGIQNALINMDANSINGLNAGYSQAINTAGQQSALGAQLGLQNSVAASSAYSNISNAMSRNIAGYGQMAYSAINLGNQFGLFGNTANTANIGSSNINIAPDYGTYLGPSAQTGGTWI